MAELVDALDSKSGDSNIVRVRFPPRPPIKSKTVGLNFYWLAWWEGGDGVDLFPLLPRQIIHFMLYLYRLNKI